MPGVWQGRVVRPVIMSGKLWMIGCTFCKLPAGTAYNYWTSTDGITWTGNGFIVGGATKSRQGIDPIVFNGQVYFFGGDNGTSGNPGTPYTDTREWQLGAPWNWLSTPNNFPPLSFYRSYVLDGVLYVAGGVNSATGVPNNQVWSSPDAYHWSPVVTTATNPPLWQSRSNHGVVVVPEPAKPDLVVTNIIWAPKNGNQSGVMPIPRSTTDQVYFTFTIKNNGTASTTLTPGSFQVTLNSVPQAIPVPPLLVVSPTSSVTLSPGQSYTFVDIPSNPTATIRQVPGNYTMKGNVDASNVIIESDETNNTGPSPYPILTIY